jgi:hypothetical protein
MLAAVRNDRPPRSGPAILVVAIALCFVAAERFPIHVPIGTERHTMSFNELALALGLTYLAPLALATATLVGSGFALITHRHQRGVKLFFNLAQLSTQAMLAVITFHALRDTPASLALGVLSILVGDAGEGPPMK